MGKDSALLFIYIKTQRDHDMKDEVEEVLESIRPMLINDGGNVELVDIEDGVVKLRLVGSCVSCPSSTMTLKMGIEKALKKAIPMVRCVESVE